MKKSIFIILFLLAAEAARGGNSLRTDNQPLWIVDGVMVSTDLNDNPDAFWQYGEKSYTSPLGPLSFLNANEWEATV